MTGGVRPGCRVRSPPPRLARPGVGAFRHRPARPIIRCPPRDTRPLSDPLTRLGEDHDHGEKPPHHEGKILMTKRVWLALLLLAGCSGNGSSDTRGNVASAKLADAALADGMPGAALNVSRSILREHPRDVGALERQGAALTQMNQPDAAMEAYRRALAVDPAAARHCSGWDGCN